MKFFPIFLATSNQRILVSGCEDEAVAKLRLILKTNAEIHVFGANAAQEIVQWDNENRLTWLARDITPADIQARDIVYAAQDDAQRDLAVKEMAHSKGALVNIVDNLHDSDFITPAIVDRDPVTIAIGTEGTAPVVARKIKSDLENALGSSVGALARIGNEFRKAASFLPKGRARRDFWSEFHYGKGLFAYQTGGEKALRKIAPKLVSDAAQLKPRKGHVDFVGAGPGDPDLLTRQAHRLIHEADVILHDALVPNEILELARREAKIICTGKRGFAPSWKQEDINAEMINFAAKGEQIVRLKSGDPTLFGRLEEEMTALETAGVSFGVVAGITTASAAAANMKMSQTQRGRNSNIRYLTGHDVKGFADQDWRALAAKDSVTAIYMGKKASKFLRGRLLMVGAVPSTPVTILENVSRPNERIITSTLDAFADVFDAQNITGPALIYLGMHPRNHAHPASLPVNTQKAL